MRFLRKRLWLLLLVLAMWLVFSSGFYAVFSFFSGPPRPLLVASRDLGRCAYVTLVSPEYVEGAVALAKSLRLSETRVKNFVALESDGQPLAEEDKARLSEYWEIKAVRAIPFQNKRWKLRQGQHRFADVLTKLRVFQLHSYARVVYLDADAMVLQNVDDLFLRDERPLAALHPGRAQPHVINAGVMTLTPDEAFFQGMMRFWAETPERCYIYDRKAAERGELKNPDQALLAGYVLQSGTRLGYLPATDNLSAHRRQSNPRIVHFTGPAKPWHAQFPSKPEVRFQRMRKWRAIYKHL